MATVIALFWISLENKEAKRRNEYDEKENEK